MRRASRSIPANLAEGWGTATERNFAHSVGQALGSANEMAVHLDFTRDLGYLNQARTVEWPQAYDVLGKRLYVPRQKRLGQRTALAASPPIPTSHTHFSIGRGAFYPAEKPDREDWWSE